MNNIDLTQLSAEQLEAALAEKRRSEAEAREAKRASYEQLKEETILKLTQEAARMRAALKAFKTLAFEELNALYDVLCEYSETHRNSEGNLSIFSQDEQFKILFRNQKKAGFDERSVEAEKLIVSFLNEKYEGDKDTQDLIFSLLERKNDELDSNLVHRLYALENRFDDDNWRKGIALLKESWQPMGSKNYINFYERGPENDWKQIKLNFSNV